MILRAAPTPKAQSELYAPQVLYIVYIVYSEEEACLQLFPHLPLFKSDLSSLDRTVQTRACVFKLSFEELAALHAFLNCGVADARWPCAAGYAVKSASLCWMAASVHEGKAQ
eukprot:327518-Pelagomonas_calceolata.AAC.2